MKKNQLVLLLLIIVAIIIAFSNSSCSAGLVIGHRNKQYQETSTKVSADSVQFVPSIQIR